MPTRIPLTLIILLGILAFRPGVAHARKPVLPYPYTKDTSCGTYRLVMLRPRFGPSEDNQIKDPMWGQYPASGLYRIGGPPVPLWTVDEFFPEHCAHPLCDGVHLVVHPGSRHRGVSFYANGRLLREYESEELVDAAFMVRDYDYGLFGPLLLAQGTVSERRLTYTLKPGDGSSFVFDISTGEIIQSHRPWRIVVGTLSALLALINIALGWQVRRAWNRPPRIKPPTPRLGRTAEDWPGFTKSPH
jgi:hypothetical protein